MDCQPPGKSVLLYHASPSSNARHVLDEGQGLRREQRQFVHLTDSDTRSHRGANDGVTIRESESGVQVAFEDDRAAPHAGFWPATEERMTYKSETEIMKALEIDSWRNLSRDKIVRFVAMMPEMDKEIAIKVIEQFPEFRKFAVDALDVLEKEHSATLAFNKESQDNVHHALQDVRAILKDELNRGELTAEERMIIIGLIMETANLEFEKDSENKRFLESLFGKAVIAGGAAIALGIVVLGGRVLIDNDEDEDRRE